VYKFATVIGGKAPRGRCKETAGNSDSRPQNDLAAEMSGTGRRKVSFLLKWIK
jgi:hypothetical protein